MVAYINQSANEKKQIVYVGGPRRIPFWSAIYHFKSIQEHSMESLHYEIESKLNTQEQIAFSFAPGQNEFIMWCSIDKNPLVHHEIFPCNWKKNAGFIVWKYYVVGINRVLIEYFTKCCIKWRENSLIWFKFLFVSSLPVCNVKWHICTNILFKMRSSD